MHMHMHMHMCMCMCPRPARSWCGGIFNPSPLTLVTTRHRRAARVGAAAAAAATRGAGVAGEPLRSAELLTEGQQIFPPECTSAAARFHHAHSREDGGAAGGSLLSAVSHCAQPRCGLRASPSPAARGARLLLPLLGAHQKPPTVRAPPPPAATG